MKIFYCCYGSAHSSVIAAAIHLNWLPWDRVPTIWKVMDQPRFDRTENRELGIPFFMGRDKDGNEVYILGLGSEKAIIRRAIFSLLSLWNYPASEVLLVNALASVHPLTRVGGFLSRGLGLVRLGRPLAAIGIRWSYSWLLSVVQTTLARTASIQEAKEGPFYQLDGL